MPAKFGQLEAILSAPLKSAYLVSGDEPLQMMQACDRIREAARARGYRERVVMTVEAGFDWSGFAAEASSTSLFSEQRLLEVRLGSSKPGKSGSVMLKAYLDDPPPDTLLLVQSARLDKSTANAAWVRSLDQMGSWVAIWPLNRTETKRWLVQRLEQQDLQTDEPAIELLLDRTEGNLLAADQEISKLALLYPPPNRIGVAELMTAVIGSARYDVHDLSDAIHSGKMSRVSAMLDGLHEEGIEPTLVAWALSREARLLARLVAGDKVDGLWRGMPPQRRRLLERAAKRWRRPSANLLVLVAARADRVVKGQSTGNPWDELLQLAYMLGGKTLFPPAWGLMVEEGRVLG